MKGTIIWENAFILIFGMIIGTVMTIIIVYSNGIDNYNYSNQEKEINSIRIIPDNQINYTLNSTFITRPYNQTCLCSSPKGTNFTAFKFCTGYGMTLEQLKQDKFVNDYLRYEC